MWTWYNQFSFVKHSGICVEKRCLYHHLHRCAEAERGVFAHVLLRCVFSLLPVAFTHCLVFARHVCSGEWSSGADSGPAPSNYGVSGRYVWYGDHSIDASLEENSNYALDRAGASYIPALPAKQGGLYACSTTDFVTWRNEGIMVRPVILRSQDLILRWPFKKFKLLSFRYRHYSWLSIYHSCHTVIQCSGLVMVTFQHAFSGVWP